jgi:hypothetical protein
LKKNPDNFKITYDNIENLEVVKGFMGVSFFRIKYMDNNKEKFIAISSSSMDSEIKSGSVIGTGKVNKKYKGIFTELKNRIESNKTMYNGSQRDSVAIFNTKKSTNEAFEILFKKGLGLLFSSAIPFYYLLIISPNKVGKFTFYFGS